MDDASSRQESSSLDEMWGFAHLPDDKFSKLDTLSNGDHRVKLAHAAQQRAVVYAGRQAVVQKVLSVLLAGKFLSDALDVDTTEKIYDFGSFPTGEPLVLSASELSQAMAHKILRTVEQQMGCDSARTGNA